VVTNTRHPGRVLIAALLATLLSISSVGTAAAQPVTDDATLTAAGWLASRFVEGERLEGGFGPDAGLTADAVFALAGAGVAADELTAAVDWLAGQVAGYTQGQPWDAEDAVYAGATAKLILALLVDGRDPTDVGGVDLVQQLRDREQPAEAGADAGRFTDTSDFGDFSSTLTQSLAVLALLRADGVSPSVPAMTFLLDQQCPDGGFRFDPDEDGCTSSADTTGFAVQALVAEGTPFATAAAADAVAWLVEEQAVDGSFDDGFQGNANSTGLAAVALAVGGDGVDGAPEALAATRGFLLGLQVGCDGDDAGAIAFSEADAGDLPRATAQAIPGLTGVGLATATADGAAAGYRVVRFDDVTLPSTHAEAICELAATGVTVGISATRFGPERAVTRGQVATLLARALDLPPAASAGFTDVPQDSVHAAAIDAAVAAGIVEGRGDGTFEPDAPVRRDQMATLLARAAGLAPIPGPGFDDVDPDSVHAPRINALAAAGITQGVTPTTFAPTATVTRAQMAAFLTRTLQVTDGQG
jgi:hypothetical protein